jgi:hypothetical protein
MESMFSAFIGIGRELGILMAEKDSTNVDKNHTLASDVNSCHTAKSWSCRTTTPEATEMGSPYLIIQV